MDPVRQMTRRAALTLALAAHIIVLMASGTGIAAGKGADSAPPVAATPTPPPAVEGNPELRLFNGATFLLPRGAAVRPRWVLPPADSSSDGVRFSVGAEGNPVLVSRGFPGSDDTYLLNPGGQYMAAMPRGISGMAHLANGVLVLASGSDLVLLARPVKQTLNNKGVPLAELQPLAGLPLRNIDVLAASGTSVYCAGADLYNGRPSLYLVSVVKGAGIRDIELVHESAEPITAVAADDEAVYLAKGRSVVRVSLKDGGETSYYTHPSSPVSGLAITPAGLLVSTGTELVLAGQAGTLEIMRSSGHRIAMGGDSLYVLFTNSLGVLALDNLADLRRFRLSVRPVAPGEVVSPREISSVRFFESDTLENSRGFAESFNREEVRRIVAQIEFKPLPATRPRGEHSVTVSWYEPAGLRLATATYQLSQWPGDRVFAVIGGEAGGNPPRVRRGSWILTYGKDTLGMRYPGRHRMVVEVDGIPAGEWPFTLTGQADPWEAILCDDLPMLKALLDQGVNPALKDENGTPLLFKAVSAGSVRAVQLLLERGANPNAVTSDGAPPLAALDYAGDRVAKAELLIRHGANVNALKKTGDEPLVDGGWLGFPADVRAVLVKNGADIEYETPLGKQSVLGNLVNDNACTDDLLSALLQRGANLNRTLNELGSRHPEDYTPLGAAISHGKEDCVKLFLDKGASMADVDREPGMPSRSALSLALLTLDKAATVEEKAVQRRIVKLLLHRGAALKSGKKVSTTARGTIDGFHWSESALMFRGEGPSFFEPLDLINTLEQDDAALKEAGRSADPAIRELALAAHLNRIRELTDWSGSESDLSYAHDHCAEAFMLVEAGYPSLQVNLVPGSPAPAAGVGSMEHLGIKMLKRATGGAYIQGVVPGGAAECAGLKAGDIILALDTRKMKDADEIAATAVRLAPGVPVRVTFLRDEPMGMPDLPLTCGLVETEYKDLWGYAEMNLSRWLAGHPDDAASAEVRARLKELTAGGRK